MYGNEHSPASSPEEMRHALRLLDAAIARFQSVPPGPGGPDAARDAFGRSVAMLRAEAEILRRNLAR